MATYIEINVDQGADFTSEITVKIDGLPFDLTGATLEGQIRKNYTSTSETTTFDLALSADPDETNVIVAGLTAVKTALLTSDRYVFDIEATLDGTVYRIAEGIINVSKNVTR